MATKLGLSAILVDVERTHGAGTVIRQASVEHHDCSGKLQGWVCYAAVETMCAGRSHAVTAWIAHVTGGTESAPLISVQVMTEEEEPEFLSCPPYVLECLTATSCPRANTWRRKTASKITEVYGYRMKIDVSPIGERSVSLVLSTEQNSVEIIKTPKLTGEEFDRTYEEFVTSYKMSSIC
ncbi:hypothetical protein Q4511_15860 [Paracoccus sp. 1_MG-2023]|uniref:hypothetical protein n=1 Tax=Paracoccus sp. 1_MG-2023 TaxID=3062651 RepID=UPI0026E28A1E|nr:hypothetical protein [Paracoccus sp. 1_MG-2023]MDO6670393.1 hypothetical protein [Paracoccus sp. 1_MG-2023]